MTPLPRLFFAKETALNIRIAGGDEEIAACFPVMQQLRPHLVKEHFVSAVREQALQGYRLASLDNGDGIVAVAGFRTGSNLAWGRFLYIDDLVVEGTQRSNGYGARMLKWLRDYARRSGCMQFHLDSGMQRPDAHRFYEREGMTKAGFHFAETI
jgi:GNAT superfamily N-acetyltransferase